ncbi:hypothetical protein BV898_05607 [Hypsibius exemplaris]|uniref:Uncharacterized protein n=1 Tax=Hypsibius exemplaris TaxID=2072580 RepID=A0A1W0WYN8_HYPEX|nr:hypothetical protein BV898_05607 [Hypsibius exemplaris]
MASRRNPVRHRSSPEIPYRRPVRRAHSNALATDEEYADFQRDERRNNGTELAKRRVLQNLALICEKYGREFKDSDTDIVDLSRMEILRDNGQIRGLKDRASHIGDSLAVKDPIDPSYSEAPDDYNAIDEPEDADSLADDDEMEGDLAEESDEDEDCEESGDDGDDEGEFSDFLPEKAPQLPLASLKAQAVASGLGKAIYSRGPLTTPKQALDKGTPVEVSLGSPGRIGKLLDPLLKQSRLHCSSPNLSRDCEEFPVYKSGDGSSPKANRSMHSSPNRLDGRLVANDAARCYRSPNVRIVSKGQANFEDMDSDDGLGYPNIPNRPGCASPKMYKGQVSRGLFSGYNFQPQYPKCTSPTSYKDPVDRLSAMFGRPMLNSPSKSAVLKGSATPSHSPLSCRKSFCLNCRD